jgi:hypothetical protein
MVVRSIIGASQAYGLITVKERQQTPWGKYWSRRFGDAVLLAVLIWGDFF